MVIKNKPIGGNGYKIDMSPFISSRVSAFDIKAAIAKILESKKNQLADLNTLQLEKGFRADGKDLGEYKQFAYKNRFRPVDLRDSGSFHKSIHPKISRTQVEMYATDEKTDMLQDKYGDEILGLSDESIQFVIDDIQDELITEARKQILK